MITHRKTLENWETERRRKKKIVVHMIPAAEVWTEATPANWTAMAGSSCAKVQYSALQAERTEPEMRVGTQVWAEFQKMERLLQ